MLTIRDAAFSYNVRTQFTFMTDHRTLSEILNQLATDGININGYEQIAEHQCNLVKLVVGRSDGESTHDLLVTKSTLRHFGVRFQTKPILQVLNIASGIPGQVNTIYGALFCRVDVDAIYIGENDNLYVEVSDLDKAIWILSQENVPSCLE
ncbi:hypothetical protein [Bacillus sp. Marseille-Q3570]|uniref:hypothetical protein n=1 Tax=Bacillus sp. Marseille-Q3570 TaxID=2963522 RepID=UPI0021B7CE54|nr:hypothetical protein [Bacillus sp. Marseille-Q3570]